MEKMSVLKPVAKQARLMNQVHTTKMVAPLDIVEARDPPTATSPSLTQQSEMVKKKRHPKGHRVYAVAEIDETLAKDKYMHLTDSLLLSDVYLQPRDVEESKGSFADVTFTRLICGYHMQVGEYKAAVLLDDLLQMLYQCEVVTASMQGKVCLGYDEWINEKSIACAKVHGMDSANNPSILAKFLITEDPEFTFFPTFLKNVGIFFKKSTVHSYPNPQNRGMHKILNPCIIKRKSRGMFEYTLDLKLIVLPPEMVSTKDGEEGEVEEDVPSTLPL